MAKPDDDEYLNGLTPSMYEYRPWKDGPVRAPRRWVTLLLAALLGVSITVGTVWLAYTLAALVF